MGMCCDKVDSNLLVFNSKPLGVIVGESKVGKTNLKDICKRLTSEFDILDTPSLDTLYETEKDEFINVLTENPVYTIFIVVEYENRFKRIAENFLKVEGLFSQQTSNIVLVISRWEMSRHPEQEKKEIYKMFEGLCNQIIFFSDEDDQPEMIEEMYKYMLNMSPKKIIIDEKFFMQSYFKFSSWPPINIRDNNNLSPETSDEIEQSIHSFDILDPPGAESNEETSKHSYQLQEAEPHERIVKFPKITKKKSLQKRQIHKNVKYRKRMKLAKDNKIVVPKKRQNYPKESEVPKKQQSCSKFYKVPTTFRKCLRSLK